jgi:release factor glutamine methyltransferase
MNIENAVLEGKNLLNDSLSANILLAHVLQKNKEYLIAHSDEDIDDEIYKKYISLLQRNRSGDPVSYITGVKEFFGLEFFVNKNVLIPRPETEHIVEKIIELANQVYKNKTIRILDIGTGSGNIAVSLGVCIKNSHISALDISSESLEVARINIKKHGLEDKIKLYRSDLLSGIEGEFDIIVANLPYIGTKENNFIAYEVENFEPHIALFGGSNGLELYEKLFIQINEKDCLNGYLLGEIGFSQKGNLEELIEKYFPQKKYKVFQDLAGFDRYFVVNCLK